MKKITKTVLAQANKKLAREWHRAKNAPLTPKDVTTGSDKKVWWVCRKGHVWQAIVGNRSKGVGCPYCAGKRAGKDNCLQAVNPKLAREWHPTKNAPLTPKNVLAGSGKKVWWVCGKGHEWKTAILHRSHGTSCPYCPRPEREIREGRSLQGLNPAFAKEWHPQKNGLRSPKNVALQSNKKAWWLCKKGHEWETSPSHRSRGNACPYCSGKKVNKENCLKTLNPELARQWHPARNALLTPNDVTPGSSIKVWWLCRKGHEWKTSISHRYIGTACPYCAGRKVSNDNCLQTMNPGLAREWHPTKNFSLTPKDVTPYSNKKAWWRCGKGHEWTAGINERSSGGGCPYCAGKRTSKDNCLQTINPGLAREWHPSKNVPLTPKDVTPGSNKRAWWHCRKGHEWEAVINSRSAGIGCPYCSNKKVNEENCLRCVNPGLAKEWHPEKNAPLTPSDVVPGSHRKACWICRNGHEWETSIYNRSAGLGCPYCSGRRATRETCIQTVMPELAQQWHPTRNAPLTPYDVSPGSNKKIWWRCRKGHEWKTQAADRKRGSGCPFCSGKRPTKENSLETRGPLIAREWHPTRNGWWTPKDVAPNSLRRVWWKCAEGHEWREPVCSRHKRGGCPVCTLKARAPQLFEQNA